jgi:hypothetical protein
LVCANPSFEQMARHLRTGSVLVVDG